MAKQTLYEILGASPDASTEDILNCYETKKWAAEQNLDPEQRRNLLAFVEYAREHLVDPHKRALYDRKLQETAAIAQQIEVGSTPAPARAAGASTLPRLLLLAALSVGLFYAWKPSREQPMPAAAPTQQPAPSTEQVSANNEVGEGLVFETTASANGTAATTRPTGTPAVAAAKQTYYAQTTAVDAELVKKLVLSVYAVTGTRGLGTGVVVDTDRLLTNCHVIAGNAHSGKMYAINTITRDKVEITEVAYLDHQDACLIRAPGITGQPIPINNFANLTTSVKTHNIGFARGNLISSEGSFLGWAYRFGQKFLVTDNYCDHGVSGGPLVDDDGRLLGLTTGGPADRSYCLSVTADTISALKFETSRPLSDFPDNYTSNVSRRN